MMLRDMTDSKRIDGHVQSQKTVRFVILPSFRFFLIRMTQSTVHPTIISRHFWPPLESSDIVMPGQFQKYAFILTKLRSGFSSGKTHVIDYRNNTQKNSPSSNRIRNFDGCRIWGPSIWSSSSKTGPWRRMFRLSKLHSSSYSRRRVRMMTTSLLYDSLTPI